MYDIDENSGLGFFSKGWMDRVESWDVLSTPTEGYFFLLSFIFRSARWNDLHGETWWVDGVAMRGLRFGICDLRRWEAVTSIFFLRFRRWMSSIMRRGEVIVSSDH